MKKIIAALFFIMIISPFGPVCLSMYAMHRTLCVTCNQYVNEAHACRVFCNQCQRWVAGLPSSYIRPLNICVDCALKNAKN